MNLKMDSYTPLYIQVFQMLREAIAQGTYKPGDKLPSEKELVDTYSISRITATAALDELVKERLAYRERGRGTFVAKPFISNFSFFSSFSEDMRERGFRPSSRLVSLQQTQAAPGIIEKLKMTPDADYFLLVRVRLADDEPVVLQYAYLPEDLYPNLLQQDFERDTLFDLMRRIYGYKPLWAEAIVEASAASAEEASYLELEEGAPVLVIWHLTLDEKYTPLEYVRSVYRSDRFSFSTGRNFLRTSAA